MQEWQVLAAWGIPDAARVAHPPWTVPVPQRVSGWKGEGTSRRGSPGPGTCRRGWDGNGGDEWHKGGTVAVAERELWDRALVRPK